MPWIVVVKSAHGAPYGNKPNTERTDGVPEHYIESPNEPGRFIMLREEQEHETNIHARPFYFFLKAQAIRIAKECGGEIEFIP
jgi:hypothetical protein